MRGIGAYLFQVSFIATLSLLILASGVLLSDDNRQDIVPARHSTNAQG
jgi:hypothetical protein